MITRQQCQIARVHQAVAAACGEPDLYFRHAPRTTKRGERSPLSEPAFRTFLDHQRCKEEVKAGLHGKGLKKGKAKKTKPTSAAAPRADLIEPTRQELFS